MFPFLRKKKNFLWAKMKNRSLMVPPQQFWYWRVTPGLQKTKQTHTKPWF